jgi:queuosine precursor transporter
MLNEILLFLHIISVVFFTLGALWLGKSALISLVCIESVLANLFVVKQMTLFGLNVTCSDVFIVGTILGLNLLQEYWDYSVAQKTVWVSFFVTIFYLIMSQFQLFYVPNFSDKTAEMFSGILKFAPRIILSSVFVSLFVQKIDCLFYAFLKKIFENKFLVARNIFSIFCTQLLDTILFSFLALYGIVESVFQIIFVSFTIKLIVILVATPFVSFSKRFVLNEIKK